MSGACKAAGALADMLLSRVLAAGLGALVAGALALAGCSADSPTAPRSEAPFTLISSDVFVVTARSGLTFVREADSVLVFRMAEGMPEIGPGTILVGSEGGGYVRRVISVRSDGRVLFVHAEPAFLSDAVNAGEMDTTVAFRFSSFEMSTSARKGTAPCELAQAAPGVSVMGDGLSLSNIILYSKDVGGGHLTVTITEGRIECNPEVALSMRMGFIGLDRLQVTAEGVQELSCAVTFEAAGRIDESVDFAAPLVTLRRTFIQRIGPVPIVEVVTMSFVAGFSVTPGFADTSGIGIETAGRFQCGMAYAHRAWSDIISAAPEFEQHPFRYESGEEGSIAFYVRPSVTVDFYGLRSAAFQCGPTWGLAEADAGFPVLEWELWAGMRGSTSFVGGALDTSTPAHTGVLSCCEATLASGPFHTDAYVFITEWGNDPSRDWALSFPKGVAVDGSGAVYVVDSWSNDVKKFTADGAFLLRWGAYGTGNGEFRSPEKIAVDEDGIVYVVDGGNDRVQKFTSDGTFVAAWGSAGSGEGQLNAPVGIAVGEGVAYVTDGGNHRVQMFSTNGDFLGAWGAYGSGPGQFDGPTGVAIVPGDGTVLVADCHNSRIQRFSAAGDYLGSWGGPGSGDEQLDCPADVTVGAAGAVFVADLGNNRFVERAADGSFVTKLGILGSGEGQFDHPEAVAVDGDGSVYVADSRNKRIQKFGPRRTPVVAIFLRELE